MYINFWPQDTPKPQQVPVQSTMAVVSSALNTVASSHWTRASSAPLRRHPCGPGSLSSTGRMSSKSQVLQEAVCQLWQLSYYPETLWKTGCLFYSMVLQYASESMPSWYQYIYINEWLSPTNFFWRKKGNWKKGSVDSISGTGYVICSFFTLFQLLSPILFE